MLRIYDIQKVVESQECRLVAKIDCHPVQWQHSPLWFSFPSSYAGQVTQRANPFLAGVLFLAMKLHLDIHIDGVVSRKMLRGIKTIMVIFHQWFPEYHLINVSASQVDETSGATGEYNGCFFSGGVDSFYTVLKNRTENDAEFKITHLLFAQGLDIPLENVDFYAAVLNHIRQITDKLGLKLIPIKTNVRQLTTPLLDWHKTHGSALAAIALCLEPLFGAVFIPGEQDYTYLSPRGAHPLTDPLWSTETLRFIHDGAEVDRIEKVHSQIARSEVALDHLRICWQNVDGQYNCGRCEKCLRTKINLYLAGALDRCSAFETREIDPRQIESLVIRDDYVLDYAKQNYAALAQKQGDIVLKKALKKAIHSYDVYHRKKWWKALQRQFKTNIKEAFFSILNKIPRLK